MCKWKKALSCFAFVLLPLGSVSCADSGHRHAVESVHAVGAVQLALTLPDGTEITEVDYVLTLGALQWTGSIDVSNSTRISFQIGALPIANGYTLTLSACPRDGVSCSGEKHFDIVATGVTPVEMVLRCDAPVDPDSERGNVLVNATVVVVEEVLCPDIAGMSVLPLEVALGAPLVLEGFTSIPATTTWSGSGVSFADPASAATTMTCEQTGTQTIRFEATRDGCPTSFQVAEIVCSPPVACGSAPGDECDGGAPPQDAGAPDCEPDASAPPPGCSLCPENIQECTRLPTPAWCNGFCSAARCCYLERGRWQVAVIDCPRSDGGAF